MIDPQLTEPAPELTNRTLRQFAGLLILVFGALVVWGQWREPGVTIGMWLAGAAILTGIIGVAKPSFVRPIFSFLIFVTAPIGRVVSLIILTAVFYLLFTPLGLVFRLFGRDSLEVRPVSRPSHWTPRRQVKDFRDYVRQ